MMLRNIPNKYTQGKLLQELDECGFSGTYNFFYLPMDVHNRSNVGYAFINFNEPADAERFFQVFSLHRFQRFHSRKVGTVCTAHVQGLNQNLRHFEHRAVTMAKNDQYRPIVFNGSARVDFEEAIAVAKAGLPESEQVSGLRQPAESKLPSTRTLPTPPVPSKVTGLVAASGQGCKEASRDSLEAAILELLKANTLTKPSAGYGGDRVPVDARPAVDDEQLLYLRSRLGDRLRDTRAGIEVGSSQPVMATVPPPGLEVCTERAYIASSMHNQQSKAMPSKLGMPEFVNPACGYDDFMDCATPRTNGLFLGQALDNMLVHDGSESPSSASCNGELH
jgi:hypothetical protein